MEPIYYTVEEINGDYAKLTNEQGGRALHHHVPPAGGDHPGQPPEDGKFSVVFGRVKKARRFTRVLIRK